MVRLFFSYAGPSMVLSHSRNRVAASKIFQWCSLTPGIVRLLRKFPNGALSLPESRGCSKNFPMVLSHSQNSVAAPKIFQLCSLTPGIVWLLRKFSNGALSLPLMVRLHLFLSFNGAVAPLKILSMVRLHLLMLQKNDLLPLTRFPLAPPCFSFLQYLLKVCSLTP